jgi:DNA repair photolyase
MIGITERGDAALDLKWHDWVTSKKPAILITKDPKLLCCYLNGTENVIIHCTITGFGKTILEPNVPEVIKAVEGMNILINKFGVERVVLRIDPIIPTGKGITRALEVFACRTKDQRVRISFLDMYTHVKERFIKNGITPPYFSLHAPLELRKDVAAQFPGAEVCGEPGFKCTGCVSAKDCEVFGIQPTANLREQRPDCQCLMLKIELLLTKHPCAHKCLYCYWQG